MLKRYFLPPDFDNPPPPDGPLSLGHILVDRLDPAPLNPDSIKTIAKPYSSYKKGFTATRGQLRQGKYGVWAQILEAVGFGGELSVKCDKNTSDTFTIKQLDTTFFNPDQKYVEESMREDAVDAWMKAKSYRKPVYMITGLKVARGASMNVANTSERSGKLDLGIDLTPAAIPVRVGPVIEGSKTEEERTAFDASSDFVYAFRLRKIWYEGDKTTVQHEPDNKGAMLGEDKGDSHGAGKDAAGVEFSQRDASAEDFDDSEDSDPEEVREVQEEEDGENCVWVVPAKHG